MSITAFKAIYETAVEFEIEFADVVEGALAKFNDAVALAHLPGATKDQRRPIGRSFPAL